MGPGIVSVIDIRMNYKMIRTNKTCLIDFEYHPTRYKEFKTM